MNDGRDTRVSACVVNKIWECGESRCASVYRLVNLIHECRSYADARERSLFNFAWHVLINVEIFSFVPRDMTFKKQNADSLNKLSNSLMIFCITFQLRLPFQSRLSSHAVWSRTIRGLLCNTRKNVMLINWVFSGLFAPPIAPRNREESSLIIRNVHTPRFLRTYASITGQTSFWDNNDVMPRWNSSPLVHELHINRKYAQHAHTNGNFYSRAYQKVIETVLLVRHFNKIFIALYNAKDY